MRQSSVGLACLVASVAVHAWAVTGATDAVARRPAPPSFMQLSVVAPAPAPEPEPAPTAVPEPPPTKAPPRLLAPQAPALAQPEKLPKTPPADAVPPQLTGQTLLSDSADAWSAPPGSGGPRQGAIVAASRPVARSVPVEQHPRALAAEPVPLARLSRKPAPPPLAAALERNYPLDARRQGKSGEAKVRARIEPSGRVAAAELSFETSPGFGNACRTTLLASKWSPPLDDAGKPVATWVVYRCKFRAED